MVAATFSWPVATPAVRVAKVILAQQLSQVVLRPPCSECWHFYRLDIAGRLGALDNPRKKVVVITDSPPSTPSTWCTAVKVAAAEALTPSGTSGTARSYAGPDKAPLASLGPPGRVLESDVLRCSVS